MFKYTKEFVLNNLKDKMHTAEYRLPNGDKQDKVVIERVGEYFKEYMSDVEKTEGHAGKVATLVITPGKLEAGEYNLRINVKLVNKYLGEYAHPNYAAFGKPIMVGFSVSESMDEKAIVEKLYEQIYEAVCAADEFVKVEKTDSDVTLTAKDFYMVFDGLEFVKYEPCGDSCNPQGEYKDMGEAIFKAEKNVEPFATGEWILENLRLPTSQNLRFGTVNDEMPIPGAVYTQYSFAYTSPRPGFGGLSGVGQRVEAVTNHVFYVHESAVADFEAAFEVANNIDDLKPAENSAEAGE